MSPQEIEVIKLTGGLSGTFTILMQVAAQKSSCTEITCANQKVADAASVYISTYVALRLVALDDRW